MMTEERHFKFCTHCGQGLLDRHGRPATELYDEELHKKSNILKLMSCCACGKVADKYIECDGPLLLIDLVLQSREAYRHVLFNGGYSALIIRMALLTLICDGYICWANIAGAGEFFEQEYQFYIMCSKAVMALCAFLTVVLLPCCVLMKKKSSVTKLLLGLLLSYSSRFCNLIALLWASKSSEEQEEQPTHIMWGFIYMLFFVSSVRVYQVTLGARLSVSVFHLALGHLAFICLLNLDYILQPYSCSIAVKM